MSTGFDVIMLSTADWDAELWTNKQHTARSLRDQGARVLYVESMGLRKPSLRHQDRRRMVRRLLRLARRPVEVEPGIWRMSPLSIPLQRYALVRLVNRTVTSFLLGYWARRLLASPPQIWTYNPLTTALVRLPDHAKLIYHCVDDISAQPSMPAEQIGRFEADLVRRADHVFVTSRSLEARWSGLGHVTYLPNCVDVVHFRSGCDAGTGPLAAVPRPRVGFVGALAGYKVNCELVLEVARAHPDWSIVLIGPVVDATKGFTELFLQPNVFHLGSCPYEHLPALMKGLDVGLIPARLNRYTTSMFPMKFFEYLAAGVPVVATDLPALQEYRDIAAVVKDEDYVSAVEQVLSGRRPSAQQVDEVVALNSYTRRTERMLALIGERGAPWSSGDSRPPC